MLTIKLFHEFVLCIRHVSLKSGCRYRPSCISCLSVQVRSYQIIAFNRFSRIFGRNATVGVSKTHLPHLIWQFSEFGTESVNQPIGWFLTNICSFSPLFVTWQWLQCLARHPCDRNLPHAHIPAECFIRNGSWFGCLRLRQDSQMTQVPGWFDTLSDRVLKAREEYCEYVSLVLMIAARFGTPSFRVRKKTTALRTQ